MKPSLENQTEGAISKNVTHKVYENAAPVTTLFIFGVFGNIIAVTVLFRSAKSHKWRPFYRFVFGLAISDGGGILLSYPFAVARYASDFTFDFPDRLCDYLAFIFMFTLMSSALIVCCMSFDRVLATFFPIKYKDCKRKRANFMLVVVWVFSGILCSFHIYIGSSHLFYPGSWCFLDFVGRKDASDIVVSYIYAIAGILIVAATAVLNFLVIAFFVRTRWCSKERYRKNDLSIIVFLLMIVAVFTSCWLPLMINILQHASYFIKDRREGHTELTLLRLGVTNSVIDPWIYILFRKETLSRLMKCVGRVIGRNNNETKEEKNTEVKAPHECTKISENTV